MHLQTQYRGCSPAYTAVAYLKCRVQLDDERVLREGHEHLLLAHHLHMLIGLDDVRLGHDLERHRLLLLAVNQRMHEHNLAKGAFAQDTTLPG